MKKSLDRHLSSSSIQLGKKKSSVTPFKQNENTQQQQQPQNKKENIQVLIRVRPINQKEQNLQNRIILETFQENQQKIVLQNSGKGPELQPKTFLFDYIAGVEATQQDIFNSVGKPMGLSVMEGYNACIFCYGQTGAGKTYTMQGNLNSSNQDERGLQIRVFEYLFSLFKEFKEQNQGSQFLVQASYYEIYNEQILDLLSPTGAILHVREDIKTGVYIEGLQEESIENAQGALQILNIGARNRHVGSTDMNLESSRSHSVFTLHIESKKKLASKALVVKNSRMNFVDLAGSERQQLTNAVGDRLKEANNINKSLTVLGLVINSLVEQSQGKSRHIPYRDSKLTFILKDSLGGNSKTSIIASVSPSSNAYQETLSTLKFAQRAKLIQNKAFINEESSGSLDILKGELKNVKKELQQAQSFIKDLQFQLNESQLKYSKISDQQLQKDQEYDAIEFEDEQLQDKQQIQQQNIIDQEEKFDMLQQKLFKEAIGNIELQQLSLESQLMKKNVGMEKLRQIIQQYQSNETHYRMIIELYQNKFQRYLGKSINIQQPQNSDKIIEEHDEFVQISQGYQSPEKNQNQQLKLNNLENKSTGKKQLQTSFPYGGEQQLGVQQEEEEEDLLNDDNDDFLLEGFTCTYSGKHQQQQQESEGKIQQKNISVEKEENSLNKILFTKITPEKQPKTTLQQNQLQLQSGSIYGSNETKKMFAPEKNIYEIIEQNQDQLLLKLNQDIELLKQENTELLTIVKEKEGNLSFLFEDNQLLSEYKENDLKVPDSDYCVYKELRKNTQTMQGLKDSLLQQQQQVQKNISSNNQFFTADSINQQLQSKLSPVSCAYSSLITPEKENNLLKSIQKSQSKFFMATECRLKECLLQKDKLKVFESQVKGLEEQNQQYQNQVKMLQDQMFSVKTELLKAQAEQMSGEQSMLLGTGNRCTQEMFSEQIQLEKIQLLQQENLGFKDQIQNYQKEIEIFQKEVQQNQEKLKKIDYNMVEKEKEYNVQKSIQKEQIKSMEAQINKLITEKSADFAKIQSELDKVEKENEELSYEKSKLQEDYEVVSSTLQFTENELEDKNIQVQKRIQQIDELRQKMESLEQNLNKTEESYQKIKNDITQKESEASIHLQEMQQEEISQLKLDNDQIKNELQSQIKNNAKIRKEFNEINNRYNLIVVSEGHYKNAFDDLKQQYYKFNENIQNLKDILQQKENQIQQLENEKQSIQQFDKNLKNEITQLRNLLDRSNKERFKIEEEKNISIKKQQLLQNEMKEILKQRDLMKDKYSEQEKQLTESKDTQAQTESKIKTLQECSQNFMNVFKAQNAELSHYKNLLQVKINEFIVLQDEQKKITEQKRILGLKLDSMDEKYEEKEKELDRAKKKYKKYKYNQLDKIQIIKDYEWDLESHQLRILELLDFICDSEKSIKELEKDIKKYYEKEKEKQKENKQEQKQKQRDQEKIQEKYEKLQDKYDKLQEKQAKYERITQKEIKNNEDLQAENNNLKDQIEKKSGIIKYLEEQKYSHVVEMEKDNEIQKLKMQMYEHEQNYNLKISQKERKINQQNVNLQGKQQLIQNCHYQLQQLYTEIIQQISRVNVTHVAQKIQIILNMIQKSQQQNSGDDLNIQQQDQKQIKQIILKNIEKNKLPIIASQFQQNDHNNISTFIADLFQQLGNEFKQLQINPNNVNNTNSNLNSKQKNIIVLNEDSSNRETYNKLGFNNNNNNSGKQSMIKRSPMQKYPINQYQQQIDVYEQEDDDIEVADILESKMRNNKLSNSNKKQKQQYIQQQFLHQANSPQKPPQQIQQQQGNNIISIPQNVTNIFNIDNKKMSYQQQNQNINTNKFQQQQRKQNLDGFEDIDNLQQQFVTKKIKM